MPARRNSVACCACSVRPSFGLDRGHLSVGQKVQVAIVALPGKSFNGAIKEIGGTVGAFWNRHFDSKITLEQVAPGMRPGMSSTIVITTRSEEHTSELQSLR